MIYFQLFVILIVFYQTSPVYPAKCGANAIYKKGCSDSANRCAENCQRKPDMCTRMCAPGCDCRPGFVFKRGQSGDCIRPEDCPNKGKSSQKKCGANAIFQQCSGTQAGCGSNCTFTSTLCTRICLSGCDCLEGFVFKEGRTGDCIRPEECPSKEPERMSGTVTAESTQEEGSIWDEIFGKFTW